MSVIRRKRYQPSEVRKIRNLFKKGFSYQEIGKEVNRTAGAIQVFVSRLGWTKNGLQNRRKTYTEKEDHFIEQWRKIGHKNKMIACGLGRSYGALRKRVSVIGA